MMHDAITKRVTTEQADAKRERIKTVNAGLNKVF
jgi:hypothetical protein